MSSATTSDAMDAKRRDAVVVASARRGDVAAFEALVECHVDRGYRIASVLLGASEAEAAVVDASLAAWRHLPLLRDGSEFGPWFDSILVSACKMRARGSGAARLPVSRGDRRPPQRPTADGVDFEEALARLDEAFDRLDLTNRSVLVLHEVAGRTLAQIAGAVHEPVGVVRVRLAESMAILIAALEAEP